ncbi:MAG: imelysin family protein [Myxococcota bacterium]
MRQPAPAIFGLSALALVAASSVACGPTEIPDKRRALLESWGEDVLLPLYRDFEARTAELDDAAETLCQSLNAADLGLARDAWWAARAPWKQAEVFGFGPYSEEPVRLGPKIDFWPVRADAIDALLASDAVIDDALVATLGATQTGMPVIEVLLYAHGDDADWLAADPRRCAYLTGLTADLRVHATEIRAAWDPEAGAYLNHLTEAGRQDDAFSTLQMALAEMVGRMAFTVENIRNDRLGRPVGLTSGGTPQPAKAESQSSGRSIEDIRDALRGVALLFDGGDAPGAQGLDGYLIERERPFTKRMATALAAAHAALDAIPGPLTEAVDSAPESVIAAIAALGDLQRLIQVDIANALSVTVGFNDNDGD